MSMTIIYCGRSDGEFHHLVRNQETGAWKIIPNVWCFPEIDYGAMGGPIARHPTQIIKLIPRLVGKTIVTMSEHIVLAFQQMVREKHIGFHELELYCGPTRVFHDEMGDLEYWPNKFFNERLELLR